MQDVTLQSPKHERIRLTDEDHRNVRACMSRSFRSSDIPAALTAGVVMKLGMKIGLVKLTNIKLCATVFGIYIVKRGISLYKCISEVQGSTSSEHINGQSKRFIHIHQADRPHGDIQSPRSTWQPHYLDMDPDNRDFLDIEPSKSEHRQNHGAYQQFRVARYSKPLEPEVPWRPTPKSSQDFPPLPSDEIPSFKPDPESTPAATPRGRSRVNKYGDVWDE